LRPSRRKVRQVAGAFNDKRKAGDVVPASRILNYGDGGGGKGAKGKDDVSRHISREHVSRVAELAWSEGLVARGVNNSCSGFSARGFARHVRGRDVGRDSISGCLVDIDTNGRGMKFPTKIDNADPRRGVPQR